MNSLAQGEGTAWSVLGTLISGPLVWGLIGWGADELIGTTSVFLPIGLVLGFITSIYVVYVRHGRD